MATQTFSCTQCSAVASMEVQGKDGEIYPFCASCSIHVLETIAELEGEEDEDPIPCEVCAQAPAVRMFLHLRGDEYMVCEDCFMDADHEPSYPFSLH